MRVSTVGVTYVKKISFFAVGVACCLGLLTACGGGGDSAGLTPPPPSGGSPSGPAPIEGVATPSSVSVVTATNAN